MKIHFQADADLNEDILTGVRRRLPEIDFQRAIEAGLGKLEDIEVLSISAAQGRLLVTHDQRTMPTAFAQFIMKEDSPGVFIIKQESPLISVIEELILIWTDSEAEEYVNSIRYLPL